MGKGVSKIQIEDIILQSNGDGKGNIDYKDFAKRLAARGADNKLIIPPPKPVVVAHTDAAHTDAAHTDAAHTDAAHTDAAHTDAAHTDAAHTDAAPVKA